MAFAVHHQRLRVAPWLHRAGSISGAKQRWARVAFAQTQRPTAAEACAQPLLGRSP